MSQCKHLGGDTGIKATCPSCTSRVSLKVFACAIHGKCTIVKEAAPYACCNGTRSPGGKHLPCLSYFSQEECPSTTANTLLG